VAGSVRGLRSPATDRINALPLTGLQGKMILTALTIRVVVEDKIF